jgi:glycosyltransferase 2 family protein
MIETQAASSSNHRRTIVLAGIVTLAIALFVFYRWRSTGFNVDAFLATFRGVNWFWLVLSIPFILATYWGRALRWQVMVKAIRPESSVFNIFVATAIGFTAIVFFGRAGELVRPYLIAKKENLPFSTQVAAWLLERILDLMMVLLMFGFALSKINDSVVAPGPKMKMILQAGGTVIGVAGATCLTILILFRFFNEKMQRRLLDAITFLPEHLRLKIQTLLSAFLQGMQSTRSNTYTLLLIGYSVLEWLLIIGCYFCLLRAFPATTHMSLTDVVIFMGFVSFGAAIQLPGVGGGMQVAAIFVFTEFFRLSLETATGLALVLWAITFVVIVPIGIILALREGLHWKNLKQISEEAS